MMFLVSSRFPFTPISRLVSHFSPISCLKFCLVSHFSFHFSPRKASFSKNWSRPSLGPVDNRPPLPDVLPCPEILQWTLSVLLSLYVLGRTPWSYQGCKIMLNPPSLVHFRSNPCTTSVDSYYITWLLGFKLTLIKPKPFFSCSATADVGKLKSLAWIFNLCSHFWCAIIC